jgi:hypothetical protein
MESKGSLPYSQEPITAITTTTGTVAAFVII